MAKNFQNGRPHRSAAMPYKKPFKQMGGGPPGNNFNQMMFNASQIPDNPGYLDFNNPTPPIGGGGGGGGGGGNANMPPQLAAAQQKKKNNKNKQKNKPPQNMHPAAQQNNGGNWNKNKVAPHPGGIGTGPITRFNGGGQRGFNAPGPVSGPIRGRRIMPPLGPGPRGGGPMPPMPPPPHGFQPPMIPPMPPMGRGPMGPPPMGVQPPPFLRRSARGGPMPPIPPPMPPMMAPRMPRGMPPVPFNGIGKIKKPNTKLVKKVVKGKSTIKTLKNLVNQYPIEKPWVTEAIRAEYDKKVDIENRLKGNKDDELFAQFKVQRDKFVSMYETAREEYLKQEAAAVKAKDAKDKQTNNKTATKDEKSKEAIPNK